MNCKHKNAKMEYDWAGGCLYCPDCDEVVTQFERVIIDGISTLVDVNDIPLYDDDAQGWEP